MENSKIEIRNENDANRISNLEKSIMDGREVVEELKTQVNDIGRNIDSLIESRIHTGFVESTTARLTRALKVIEEDKNKLVRISEPNNLLERTNKLKKDIVKLEVKENNLRREMDNMLQRGLELVENGYSSRINMLDRGMLYTRPICTINRDNKIVQKYKDIKPNISIPINEKLKMSDVEDSDIIGCNINNMVPLSFKYEHQREVVVEEDYYAYKQRVKKLEIRSGQKVVTVTDEVLITNKPNSIYSVHYDYDKRLKSIRKEYAVKSSEYALVRIGKNTDIGFTVENIDPDNKENIIAIQNLDKGVSVEIATDTFKFMMVSASNMHRIRKILEKIYYEGPDGKRDYKHVIKQIKEVTPHYTNIKAANENDLSVVNYVLNNSKLFHGTPPLNTLLAIENLDVPKHALSPTVYPGNPSFKYIFDYKKEELGHIRKKIENNERIIDDLAEKMDNIKRETSELIIRSSSEVLNIVEETYNNMRKQDAEHTRLLSYLKQYKAVLNTTSNLSVRLNKAEIAKEIKLTQMKMKALSIEADNIRLMESEKRKELKLQQEHEKQMVYVRNRVKQNELKLEHQLGAKMLKTETEIKHHEEGQKFKHKIFEKDVDLKHKIVEKDVDLNNKIVEKSVDLKHKIVEKDVDLKHKIVEIKKSNDADVKIKKLDIKAEGVQFQGKLKLEKKKLKLAEKKADDDRLSKEAELQYKKLMGGGELDLNRAKLLADIELKRLTIINKEKTDLVNHLKRIDVTDSLVMTPHRTSNKGNPMFEPDVIVDTIRDMVSTYLSMRF